MNKILSALLGLGLIGLLGPVCYAQNNISDQTTDIIRYKHKGSSNTAMALDTAGQLNMPSGLVSKQEYFPVVPACSTIAYYNGYITTTTLAAYSTGYLVTTGFTQPAVPTVLMFHTVQATATANAFSRDDKSTATVVGVTARGQTVTESVITSTTPALSNYAYVKINSIAWAAPVSITLSSAPYVYLNVGSTATYGMSSSASETGDVFKTVSWGIDVTSYTVTVHPYNTIKFDQPSTPAAFSIWTRDKRSSPPLPR